MTLCIFIFFINNYSIIIGFNVKTNIGKCDRRRVTNQELTFQFLYNKFIEQFSLCPYEIILYSAVKHLPRAPWPGNTHASSHTLQYTSVLLKGGEGGPGLYLTFFFSQRQSSIGLHICVNPRGTGTSVVEVAFFFSSLFSANSSSSPSSNSLQTYPAYTT